MRTRVISLVLVTLLTVSTLATNAVPVVNGASMATGGGSLVCTMPTFVLPGAQVIMSVQAMLIVGHTNAVVSATLSDAQGRTIVHSTQRATNFEALVPTIVVFTWQIPVTQSPGTDNVTAQVMQDARLVLYANCGTITVLSTLVSTPPEQLHPGCPINALPGTCQTKKPPVKKPSVSATKNTWFEREISTTAMSHDRVCGQYNTATINRFVGYLAALHTNYVSVDTPLDQTGYDCKPSAPPITYMTEWVTAIRAAGMHVVFRDNWNTWAGDYGQPKLTYATKPAVPYETSSGLQAVESGRDTASYIGKTYQFILAHGSLFANGDIWEPFGEPMNNGIKNCAGGGGYGNCYGTSAGNCPGGLCQFPSVPAFNQWLEDFTQADLHAFALLHKTVTAGWFGVAGDTYKYTNASTWQYASYYNMDHFAQSFSNFSSLLVTAHTAFPKLPITLEWGDINGKDNTRSLVATTTSQYMTWAAQQSWIKGFEYWYIAGNNNNAESAAVDYNTGQLEPAGLVVQRIFGQMSPS
jgi:hypothetical protein